MTMKKGVGRKEVQGKRDGCRLSIVPGQLCRNKLAEENEDPISKI